MSAFTFERAVEITNEAVKDWAGPEHAVYYLAGFIVGHMQKAHADRSFKTERVEVLKMGIRLHGKGPSSMQSIEISFPEDVLFMLEVKERPSRFDREVL